MRPRTRSPDEPCNNRQVLRLFCPEAVAGWSSPDPCGRTRRWQIVCAVASKRIAEGPHAYERGARVGGGGGRWAVGLCAPPGELGGARRFQPGRVSAARGRAEDLRLGGAERRAGGGAADRLLRPRTVSHQGGGPPRAV